MRSHFNTEKSKCPVVSSKKRLLMATVIRANWAPGDRVHEQVWGEELRRDYNHFEKTPASDLCHFVGGWLKGFLSRPRHQTPWSSDAITGQFDRGGPGPALSRKSPNDQITLEEKGLVRCFVETRPTLKGCFKIEKNKILLLSFKILHVILASCFIISLILCLLTWPKKSKRIKTENWPKLK